MSRSHGRRLSPAIVISVIALVVAASGTAVAAGGLVSGNKLIRKDSLSGNRLVNKSVTGTQVKSDTLNTMPKADKAGYATDALNATNAVNAAAAVTATTATTAGNATDLSGLPASAYEPSGEFARSGLVEATQGQTVTLLHVAPFTLTLDCVNEGGANVEGQISATTTSADSVIAGVSLGAGGTDADFDASASDNVFQANTPNTVYAFDSPTGANVGNLEVGTDFPGAATSTCFATALISAS
jgi:hypothetical protein